MEPVMRRISLAALMLLAAPLAANAASKAIYGGDDRKEYFEVPKEIQAMADAVVSLWDESKVLQNQSGSFLLSGRPFADKVFNREGGKLCDSEPFRSQPIGAECSGTLVGEDLVMTAGHCINTQHDCDAMRIVFDFNIRSRGGAATTIVPASSVYLCKSIVSSRNEEINPGAASQAEKTLDYAIIRLDRKVTGRKPLSINRKGGLAAGSPLFSIGHPAGLPAKIADGAEVMDIRQGAPCFVANLDTYGGNSGSGVFNERTGLLEGILVRGRDDFRRTPEGCYVSQVFEQNPADGGEIVTKISVVAGFIPEPEGKRDLPPEPVAVDLSGIQIDVPAKSNWEDLARGDSRKGFHRTGAFNNLNRVP
jgi:hypothetical protein